METIKLAAQNNALDLLQEVGFWVTAIQIHSQRSEDF